MKIEVQYTEQGKKFYEQGLAYAKPGDAGVDLRAMDGLFLTAGSTVGVDTGIKINMSTSPFPMVALIMPRSGLGTRGLILANTIGVIDKGYQGPLIIQAWNRSRNTITLQPGERLAQLVFLPCFSPEFVPVEEFSTETARGQGGFGSTGA